MYYVVAILILSGLFFFAVGSLGVIRLPDFYTRLHSAGMMDSMGLLLCMTGLTLLELHHFSLASCLTAMKIVLIVMFVYITSPTATHAIVDAGVRAGLEPWTRKNLGLAEETSQSAHNRKDPALAEETSQLTLNEMEKN